DAFVEALSAGGAEQSYEVVFASSDEDMLALASAPRERIPARVPYPPRAVLERAMDKLELSEAARRVGLAAPPAATSEAAARELVAAGPVVVKERLHGATGRDGRPTHVNPLISNNGHEAAGGPEE